MTRREELRERYAEYKKVLNEKRPPDYKDSCGTVSFEYSPGNDCVCITEKYEDDIMSVVSLSGEQAEKLYRFLGWLYG